MANLVRDNLDDEMATKRKPKMNIFDDFVSVGAASEWMKNPRSGGYDFDDDEDDEELVGWDGSRVMSYNKRPSGDHKKLPVPDLSSLAQPCPSSTSRNDPVMLGMPKSTSFGGFKNAAAVNFEFKTGNSNMHGKHGTSLDDSTEAQGKSNMYGKYPFSIDDSTEEEEFIRHKQTMSPSEIAKIQQENQQLKRALARSKADKWVKLPVEDILRRVMKGEPYSFELYKSLDDKLQLLDTATRKSDGNAITAVVIFLKRTISQQIFERELLNRPIAADHYLNYLRDRYDFDEYVHLLSVLGRSEEAAMLLMKRALQTADTTMKLSRLKSALRTLSPSDSGDASLIQEYIDLLERQLPVEQSDAQLEASGKTPVFIEIPRRSSLVNMSVVTTLYYLCLYHFDSPENSLRNPQALKKRHKISDQQFMWTSVAARAKRRHWKDVEGLMTTKGWFGGTKLKAVIGFGKIVEILHRNNAPNDVLNKYLSLMDDPEARLELAKKVGCHRAVIDTFIALKDRSSLQSYSANLDRYSQDGLYASDVLNSSTYKWK